MKDRDCCVFDTNESVSSKKYDEYLLRIDPDLTITIIPPFIWNITPKILHEGNIIVIDCYYHIFEIFAPVKPIYIRIASSSTVLAINSAYTIEETEWSLSSDDKIIIGLVDLAKRIFYTAFKDPVIEKSVLMSESNLKVDIIDTWINYYTLPLFSSMMIDEQYRIKYYLNKKANRSGLVIQRGITGLQPNCFTQFLDQINFNIPENKGQNEKIILDPYNNTKSNSFMKRT